VFLLQLADQALQLATMLEEVKLQLDTVQEVLMEVLKQAKAIAQQEDRILAYQPEQMDLVTEMEHKVRQGLIITMGINEETPIQLGIEQTLKQIEILIQIQEEVLRQAIISQKRTQDLLITNRQTQEVLLIQNQAQGLITLK
jgi:hypothetical protein